MGREQETKPIDKNSACPWYNRKRPYLKGLAFMRPTCLNFSKKNYSWRNDIDYRKSPELYRVGKGEQGVLICEPYKSEILPHWRFRTPSIAKESSACILRLFHAYLKINDFVGADLARKFLQMGYTRARRYANYKGGIKYDKNNDGKLLKKGTGDKQKAISAKIFYAAWKRAEDSPKYKKAKKNWKLEHG